MRRRAFCAGGLAAFAAATVPYRRSFAATAAADIPAVGLDGRQLTLKATDIDDLRAGLRGELITPDQPGYETVRRLWNPAFDRKPALIVRCAGAADVRRAVSFAAGHSLLTAVRGGGHSVSGQSGCDGGIVIDLTPMRAVEVDPIARTARVEGGALLGQLDREALAFGLATPVGTVADTGVAGLTLGGGVGRLGRRFGLTCDNMTGAELITADGRWVRVSGTENPDLLWGLRGGGGNFGVVTSFTFRLHEVAPQMYGGTIIYPFDGARQIMHGFADYIAAAPDELYVDAVMGTDAPGERWLAFAVCYSGPPAEASRVVGPMHKLGKPIKDGLAPATYDKLQGSADLRGISPLGGYGKGGAGRWHYPGAHRHHGGIHRECTARQPDDVAAAAGRCDQPRAIPGYCLLQSTGEPQRRRFRGLEDAGRGCRAKDGMGAQRLGEDRAADARPVREPRRDR